MDVARQIFNSQHSTTNLIRCLCLNEVNNYLTFKRTCKLAKLCCVIANERGFGFVIRVDIKENKNLINDIRSW